MAKRLPIVRVEMHAMTPRVDARGRLKHYSRFEPVDRACELCPARCCHLTVHVSLPEVLRLSSVLEVPFHAAFAFVPGEGVRSFALDAKGDPRAGRYAEEWPGRGVIALRRLESGACQYLVDVGGFWRCGIYELRPATCRLYPVTWETEAARGGPPMVLCPVPYVVTPERERQLRRDVGQTLENWALHEEIVAAWEARPPDAPRRPDDFLRFALTAAGERLSIDPTKALETRAAGEILFQTMVDTKVISGPKKPPG